MGTSRSDPYHAHLFSWRVNELMAELGNLRAPIVGIVLLAMAPLAWAKIALNPDVTQASIANTICVPGYTKSVRPSTSYTNGVKRKLLREIGLEETHLSDFELDHIIPLALGGHPRSLDNLMLQPWEGVTGAKKKDRLEVKLQCLVCSRQLELSEAQQVIYSDWPTAYHTYAKTKCQRGVRERKRSWRTWTQLLQPVLA